VENTVALQVTAFTIKTGQRNKKFPTHQKVDFVVAVLIICDKYGSYITSHLKMPSKLRGLQTALNK
jgi:hypothetical protein